MSHVRSSSEVGQHLFLLQALPSRHDMHAKISGMSRSCSLACLSVFLLGQTMLLQQSRDLVGTPKMMVDLAIFGFPHCGELDCILIQQSTRL